MRQLIWIRGSTKLSMNKCEREDLKWENLHQYMYIQILLHSYDFLKTHPIIQKYFTLLMLIILSATIYMGEQSIAQ